MDKFKFDLAQEVLLSLSGERGVVVGRAEYVYCENNYLVRYTAGDGRQVEQWWSEGAIKQSE